MRNGDSAAATLPTMPKTIAEVRRAPLPDVHARLAAFLAELSIEELEVVIDAVDVAIAAYRLNAARASSGASSAGEAVASA